MRVLSDELNKNFLGSSVSQQRSSVMSPAAFIDSIDTSETSFVVQIVFRDPMMISMNASGASAFVKSVKVPEIGFEDAGSRRGMYVFHGAGDVSVGQMTIDSYNDLSSSVLYFWTSWREKIIRSQGSTRLFPDEYKADVTVWKINKFSYRDSLSYKLGGCYPSSLTAPNMDWSSLNSAPSFSVTMSVDTVEVTSSVSKKELISTISTEIKSFEGKKSDVSQATSSAYSSAKKKISDSVPKWTEKAADSITYTVTRDLVGVGQAVIRDTVSKIKDRINEQLPDWARLDFIDEAAIARGDWSRIFSRDRVINQISNYISGAIKNRLTSGVNSALNGAFGSDVDSEEEIKRLLVGPAVIRDYTDSIVPYTADNIADLTDIDWRDRPFQEIQQTEQPGSPVDGSDKISPFAHYTDLSDRTQEISKAIRRSESDYALNRAESVSRAKPENYIKQGFRDNVGKQRRESAIDTISSDGWFNSSLGSAGMPADLLSESAKNVFSPSQAAALSAIAVSAIKAQIMEDFG